MAIFKLVDLAILAPAAVIAGIISIRFSISTWFVEGLTQYTPSSGNTGVTIIEPNKSSKKVKAGDKKNGIGLGDAENLISHRIPRTQVITALFHGVLDNMLFGTLFVLLACLGYAVAGRYLGHPYDGAFAAFSPTPVLLSLGLIIVALKALCQVDLFSRYSSADDKSYVIIFGILGIISAAAFFALEPKENFFLWSPNEAAEALIALGTAFAKKAAPEVTVNKSEMPFLKLLPSIFRGLLCLLAGPISGLLLASAMRFVRAHKLQQNPPEWAQAQIKTSFINSAKMNLALIMPAAAALTWTGPLFKEALGLDDGQTIGLQAIAALLTGFFFLSTCRVALQRYLDTALLAWHTFKHGARRNERASIAEIIQLNANAVRRLVVKVGVQTIGPGILFVAFGLALGSLAAHPSRQTSEVAKDVERLVSCFIGFLVWWSGISWILYCAGAMWLFRTGTLQN